MNEATNLQRPLDATVASSRAARVGRRLAAMAGLDFHVAVTLMFRSWTIVAGAATMVLLPLWLTPTLQGYYYTFASILALQVFFELGLNQIVSQLVSHEVAHLTMGAGGELQGDALHLDRLGSLARLMRRWYAVASVLFVAGGGAIGIGFFLHKGGLAPSGWLGPWCLLTCASAINLYFSPALAMQEGTGQVGQVARLRLIQSCVGYLCLWTALFCGAGLWAAAAAPLVGASCTGWWLGRHGVVLRRLAARSVDANRRVLWRRDVFPFQWRIALSWASGYFIFNMFTPMVFSHQGAVEAGRLGMALTVFNAVSTVGMSWINARNPQFAMHISRNERGQLNALFGSVVVRACLATAALSLVVVGGAWALDAAGLPVMRRIASLDVLGCLAWVTVVNSVIFAAAGYMRAHREEPMLPVSIVTGTLIGAVAWFGSRAGVAPMMFLYAAVTTLLTLPWTLVIFSRYYKKND